MIKPVSYKIICKWIKATRTDKATPVKIPTLGGESYFYVWCFANRILTTRRGINEYIYYPEMWDAVCKHMNTLTPEQREKGKYYTPPFWKECPDRNTSPGIGALCKEYWNHKD